MRRRRLVGLVASAALLLAACGDQAGPALERSQPTTATAADPTPAPTVAPTTPPASGEPDEDEPAAATPASDVVAAHDGEVPRPAADAAELAARVATAEQAVRDPATTGDALFQAAFEQQVLYRQLAREPEWEAAVLDALPEQFRHAAWANANARREFRSMHSRLNQNLPAWRIVDPLPAEELLGLYEAAEAEFGVPWEVLAAVHLVETGMGRIRGVSVAGAQGPMQFMPATWAAFGDGGDVNDHADAIRGAARYLAHNGGGSGDVDNALFNYNRSRRYVEGVKLHASVMAQDPAAYRGYHQWQIVYLTVHGDLWLPTGFETDVAVPASDHLTRNPWAQLGTATG